jgi:hypothetical protein
MAKASLRLVEYGQEICTAHEYQGSSVVQHVEEVDGSGQQTPEDHHQHRQVLVYPLEQPVESQHEENQDGPAEQVADDAETEKQLMSGDVVGRRGRVATHDLSAGNVDEAEGGEENQE